MDRALADSNDVTPVFQPARACFRKLADWKVGATAAALQTGWPPSFSVKDFRAACDYIFMAQTETDVQTQIKELKPTTYQQT